MSYDIKLFNKISPVINEKLPGDRYNIGDALDSFDAAIVRSAKLTAADLPERMIAIARAGAGYNNIPVADCTGRGVVVFNTPGANANAVKELVLCALLLSCRGVVEGINWVAETAGTVTGLDKLVESKKSEFAGSELKGKTLGVVGLGAIGVMVANSAAEGLGMEVIGFDPYISPDSEQKLVSSVRRADALGELISLSDYLTLHLPLTGETEGMIGEAELSRIKNGAVLLNFARGGLVDDGALLAALAGGRLSRYVTDFPNDTLAGVKGVMAIPHLGASTEESEENCARMAAAQLRDYLENGNVVNSVNLPACSLPRTAPHRLAVISLNAADAVPEISAALGECKVENILHKSRGDIAYTLVDLKQLPGDELLGKIAALDGVVRVRVIA